MRWLARAALLTVGVLALLFVIGMVQGLVLGLMLFAQIVSDLAHGY